MNRLQLDVDLSTAPGPGAVQLEMWAGLNILASAPLLLLPPLLPAPDHHQPDPLLEELRQHVAQHSWVEGAAGETSGMSAFLSDLGQVLFAANCIKPATHVPDRHSATQLAPAGQVAAQGAIVTSLAQRHRSDPDVLRSILSLAEGAAEFAHAEGLHHVAAMVESARVAASQRLRDSSPSGSSQAASQQQEVAGSNQQESASSPQAQITLRDCMAALVHGFAPGSAEDQYLAWSAQRCAPLLLAWKPWMLVWVVATNIGSVRRGDTITASDVPLHILMCAPHAVTCILALTRRHR
jgi:hypothetical protein